MSIIQEAIDFGYPDETSESAKQNQPSVDAASTPNNDPSAPTVNADASQDPNADVPAPDDGSNADNMSQSPTDDPNAQPPTDDANKEQVDTNDVSDQIAEKVSDELNTDNQDTGADANGDISIDDTNLGDTDSTNDMSPNSGDDAFGNIDNSLDDLDNTNPSSNDTAMGDPANMDINSMSIDDIMAQAAEKLKSMPIEQVKQFLTDGTGAGMDMDTTSTDLQQESFF